VSIAFRFKDMFFVYGHALDMKNEGAAESGESLPGICPEDSLLSLLTRNRSYRCHEKDREK
jgi:hypothetical protein